MPRYTVCFTETHTYQVRVVAWDVTAAEETAQGLANNVLTHTENQIHDRKVVWVMDEALPT